MNNFKLELTKHGAIKSLQYKDVLVNMAPISSIDDSVMNVYIKGETEYFGILDVDTQKKKSEEFGFIGSRDGIDFELNIDLHENGIFTFDVTTNVETEIIFATDICLGNEGIRSNIAYASQYIDNRAYESENGYIVAMRRTTKQGMGFPFIQVGANKKVVEYATEGYDFYKTISRESLKPQGLERLASRERNYEHAFIAEKVIDSNVTFYGYVEENREDAITELTSVEVPVVESRDSNYTDIDARFNLVLNGQEYTNEEIQSLYELNSTEYIDGKLASFFTNDYAHVVTPFKELKTDRTHASIITSGNHKVDNSMQLVTTNYMNGVFGAQVAVSNTGINKLNSNVSSGLFLNALEGTRLFVKDNNVFKMLNVPTLYEMGFNYSKWIYKLEDNKIEVITYTEVNAPNVNFEIKVGKPTEFILTDNIDAPFEKVGTEFTVKEDSFQGSKYPNLKYKYVGDFEETIELNIEEENIVSLKLNVEDSKAFKILTTTKEEYIESDTNFEDEVVEYSKYIETLKNGLKFEGNPEEEFEWNATVYWYISNALIHFATPHGVEQHGGAAWGSRDVCQGPVELFAALGQYAMVKDILLEVFKNQSLQSKNWPQWFMFDNYSNIRAGESHGDIIVWPLKALGDYIAESGDVAILDEKVPYYDQDAEGFTKEEFTIREHLSAEVKYIEDNFVPGTYLSQYADGDWDDTLQPFNEEDRKLMVSGWTTSLTYQAISTIAPFMGEEQESFETLAKCIKDDYYKYIIKDGVASGFIKYHNADEIDYLLHPNDTKTNIKYRLLPMNRGIISGLFDEKEIEMHHKLMNEKLLCPDGIRLMDNPAPYHGGVCSIFQRAESASTVGREISLQYVHAHIRYIEAMCKIGEAKAAYYGLKIINPIMVNRLLPSANLRQRNAYYSSSEGDFNNRYEYEKGFNKLFTGDVTVKSGWRIYSSGPGIYLKQLLSNFYGRKYEGGELTIDSKLPSEVTDIKIS